MKRNIRLLALLAIVMSSCSNSSSDEITKESIVNEDNSISESSSISEVDSNVISHDDFNNFKLEKFKVFGRSYITNNCLVLDNSASGGEYYFDGTESSIFMNPSSTLYVKVFVDDDKDGKTITVSKNKKYKVASDLIKGVHKIRFVKLNSTFNGSIQISEISCDGDFLNIQDDYDLSIEFVGDSITCGAGVLASSSESPSVSNTDVTKGYAYLSACELNASYSFNSVCGMCVKAKTALNFNMIETYPCYSYSYRGKYDFTKTNDIVVVSLGTNDAYYVGNDQNKINEFVQGYKELLLLIRDKNPTAKIICVYGLMNNVKAISDGINQAINDFNDNNTSYLQLPTDNKGAESHPGVDGAIKQKNALVNYIKEITHETK